MKKAILLTIAYMCLSSVGYAQSWPEITPVSGEVIFTDTANATLKVNIIDIHRKPVYTLDCQSGDVEPEDKNFNFSGLFHCRLVSLYSSEYVSSLLVENPDQTAD